jgi:hypothetical protein
MSDNLGFALYHLPGQGDKKKKREEDIGGNVAKLTEQHKTSDIQVRIVRLISRRS